MTSFFVVGKRKEDVSTGVGFSDDAIVGSWLDRVGFLWAGVQKCIIQSEDEVIH